MNETDTYDGPVPPPWDDDESPEADVRVVTFTRASDIKPRRVIWLWKGRLALGTLGLLAGREGLGKSTLGYWLAARLTQGELYGEYQGTPKSVIVCATEDSWEHTIVPRLIAAGADLERVYRVEVIRTDLGVHGSLSLPRDLPALARQAAEVDSALMLLDPLMSRLGSLDTHRDAEVRQALEPLVAMADRTGMAVLGLIHHNKSGSTDPLQLVMGSKAFTAVARSVHTVVADPDDDMRRLFGTPKNNLGRTDLPTLSFTIVSHPVETDDGTAWTGRLEWGDERAEGIAETMRRAATSDDERSAATEAAEWLSDYMQVHAGQVPSADVKQAARKAGHSDKSLRSARERLALTVTAQGFPRVTYWELAPVVPSVVTTLRGEGITDLTDSTVPVASVAPSHKDTDPTGDPTCPDCTRRLSRTELPDGVCIQCRRIRAAEAAAS